MTCINCGTEGETQFCPNCGQKNPAQKITVGHLYHDFQARIYGFDGMFPRTLRDITLRPGHVARKFIEGNRVLYYGPVGYFFLMITVLLLLMSLLDVDLIEFLKQSSKASYLPVQEGSKSQAQFTQAVFQFVSENLKWISFAIIPVQALCSRFIVFRKSGFNYLEHSVLPFYVQGHLYWISIVSVIYYKIAGVFLPPWIAPVIGLSYFSFAYANFFNYQSKSKAFFKGLSVYVAAQVIFFVIVAAIVVLLVLLNPDIQNMLKPSHNP